MNTRNPVRHYRGAINRRMLIALIAVVVVLVGVYLLWPGPEPIPAPGRPLETVEPAKTAEERGDTAREIIARLREDPAGPDYAEAYTSAQAYQAEGRFADAQLLYFFAARGGYAPAAFNLATFNDPNYYVEGSGMAASPDAFQAYRWYVVARDAGNPDASQRLEELRAWAESASLAGDADAEQLLLQWEHTP